MRTHTHTHRNQLSHIIIQLSNINCGLFYCFLVLIVIFTFVIQLLCLLDYICASKPSASLPACDSPLKFAHPAWLPSIARDHRLLGPLNSASPFVSKAFKGWPGVSASASTGFKNCNGVTLGSFHTDCDVQYIFEPHKHECSSLISGESVLFFLFFLKNP